MANSNALDFTSRPTVLVVDDSAENLSLMSSLLKGTYRLKVANSGEKALAYARSEPKPDIVLLDIMMPGMSGYEVLQALKADDATRYIPVIFLTARTDAEGLHAHAVPPRPNGHVETCAMEGSVARVPGPEFAALGIGEHPT